MRRLLIIATCAIALVGAIICLKSLGRSLVTSYLKTHATQEHVMGSEDGRFQIVIFRYPHPRDIPETLGFGQGFVQLQQFGSGKVLAQKDAADLAQLNAWKWTSNRVTITGFAEWDLPQ